MPDVYAKLDDKTYVKIPEEIGNLPPDQAKAWIMQRMAPPQQGPQEPTPTAVGVNPQAPPPQPKPSGASGSWDPKSFGEKFESGLIPPPTAANEAENKAAFSKILGDKIGPIAGSIASGIHEQVSNFSSPENLAILGGTMVAPGLAAAKYGPEVAKALRMMIAGGFGAQAARAFVQVAPEAYRRAQQGDYVGAAKLLPASIVSLLGAAGGAHGLIKEAMPSVSPTTEAGIAEGSPETMPKPSPNVVQTAQGGVEKNAPPAPEIRADLNQALAEKGVDHTNPQAAAQAIAAAKGVQAPVKAEPATEPISQALKTDQGYIVQHEAPAGTPDVASNVAHEMDHVLADEQGAPQPPEGPGANDKIVADTTKQVRDLPPPGFRILPEEQPAPDPNLERLLRGEPSLEDQAATEKAAEAEAAKARKPPPMATPQLTRGALSFVTKYIAPEFDVSSMAKDNMAQLRGHRNATRAMLYANDDMNHAKAVFDALPPEDNLDVWDALKGFKNVGDLNLHPQVKQAVTFLKGIQDAIYDMRAKYAPGLNKLESHFRAFWDFPGEEPGGDFGRSITGGLDAFKKASRLPVRQIMKQYPEAKLRYTNPVDAIRADYESASHFFSAARSLDDAFRGGMVRTDQPSPSWVPLGGKGVGGLGKTLKISDEGQQLYADPGFGRLWNNYFSTDKIAATGLGKTLLGVKNATTGYELMIPTVHLGNESRIASSADFMQAAYDALRGKPMKAADLALEASVPGRSFQRLVDRFPAYYKEMGALDFVGKTNSRLRLIFDGGATADFEKGYLGKAMSAFREGLDSSPLGRTLGRILDQPERLAGPLFRQIQMAKIVFAMDRLNQLFELHGEDLAAGKMSELDLARRAVSMADNYMGVVPYRESWFWDATFRSAMQIAFRAPGWFLGSVRGAARGISDLPKALTGEVTPEAAMFVASFIPTAMHAVMVQSALTGTLPGQDGDMEDYLFPKSGGVDSNGKPSRVAVFGYPSEWAKYGMATINPLLNKSMNWLDVLKAKQSGMIGRAEEAKSGVDFYGRKIGGGLAGRAAHLLPMPFFVQSAMEAKRRGTQINTAMGDKPAPQWVDATPATDLMSQFGRAKAPAGGTDPDVWENRAKQHQFEDRLRNSPAGRQLIIDEMRKSGIDQKHQNNVLKNSALNPLVARFKSLSTDEMKKVYEVANDKEKALFRPIMGKRLHGNIPRLSPTPSQNTVQ